MAIVILNGGDLDGRVLDHPDVTDPKQPPATITVHGITFRLMDSWPHDVAGRVRYLAPIDPPRSNTRAARPHTT